MTNNNKTLLDLVQQERARRAGASDYEVFVVQGWTETKEQWDARLDGLRAAGKIGPDTKIVGWPGGQVTWIEPPYLHEVRGASRE